MNLLKVLILASALFAQNSFSAISETAWTGNSELTLDNALYCSSDQTKNPIYRPVIGGPFSGITVREGSLGWIWLEFSGGCANGWLNGSFGLQISGTQVLDKSGKVIGSRSDTSIEARNFSVVDSGVQVSLLSLKLISNASAVASVKFQSRNKAGTFLYTATLNRHHDSNWP